MRTATGKMLAQRERRCLWSPDELVAVYDDALGDPDIWDDVVDVAGRIRRAGFADTVGRSETVSSVGPAVRIEVPASTPVAHLQLLGGGGKAGQVATLARLRQEVKGTTLAVVPEQHDLETLRSLRRAGADVCMCGDGNGPTGSPALQSLLDAQNSASEAGFTRCGLTATIGADAGRELALVMLQSNHLMEELGLHPHTIAVRRDPGGPSGRAADGSRDPFLLQVALLRVAHPSSNISVPADSEPDMLLQQLDVGANLIGGPVPPAITRNRYRIVGDAAMEPELCELFYRRLASIDHAGGLISEFRTKRTETYMLVRRPAGPGALGNNLHRGLYRSKDPETVVLVEGSLAITSRHPDRPEPMTTVITSTSKAAHKLTVPRNVYHEVVAETDSLLIEFCSVAEDTTDSFPWPPASS